MVSGLVQAPWEHQVELVEGGSPAAGGQGSPGGLAGVVDAEVAAAEVEQLDQGVVVGEVPSGLADLAELVVDALDHVGGVEHPADLGGVGEERDDCSQAASHWRLMAGYWRPMELSVHRSRASRA